MIYAAPKSDKKQIRWSQRPENPTSVSA